MARPSKIDRLPPEIREEIGRLRDKGRTLDEIMAALRELGAAEEISRSGLGRHVHKVERMAQRLRQSRQVAEAVMGRLDGQDDDKVARYNIELVHTLISDLMAAGEEETQEGAEARALVQNPQGLKLVAEAVERLGKASRLNQDFVERLERRAAEKAKNQAADQAEQAAREAGLQGPLIETIRRRILGIAA